jgi:hypothetical protein
VPDQSSRGARFLAALSELVAVAFADDLTKMVGTLASDFERGTINEEQVRDRLTPVRGALLGRLQRALGHPTFPVLRALWTVAQYDPSDQLRVAVERLAIAWRDAPTERRRREVAAELRAWGEVHASTLGSVALRGPF